MSPIGHQQNNKYQLENRDLINMNHATQTSSDLSVNYAVAIATYLYLNELQKKNLITPCIAIPFPKEPVTEKKLVVHRAYRQVQKFRLEVLKKELFQFKESKVPICFKTLKLKKLKFKKKIAHLVRKFSPQPVTTLSNAAQKKVRKDIKSLNRKSRERYLARKYKDRLISYVNNPQSRGALNLSSVEIDIDELLALELGYGFVVSPNNAVKEEETLILEGCRFLDRLGKADAKLAEERKRSRDCIPPGEDVVVTGEVVQDEHLFSRNASVPQKLFFSQPKEHQLQCNETKCVKSEFEDL